MAVLIVITTLTFFFVDGIMFYFEARKRLDIDAFMVSEIIELPK